MEAHDAPVALVGYEGGARTQEAEIVLRRRHLSSTSNDIGFRRTPTGFAAVISDYDRGRFGERWLQELHGRYRHHAERKQARAAEEERRRLEEERRLLVEAQRQAVHEKARASWRCPCAGHGTSVSCSYRGATGSGTCGRSCAVRCTSMGAGTWS